MSVVTSTVAPATVLPDEFLTVPETLPRAFMNMSRGSCWPLKVTPVVRLPTSLVAGFTASSMNGPAGSPFCST